jgi:hypothetical protein
VGAVALSELLFGETTVTIRRVIDGQETENGLMIPISPTAKSRVLGEIPVVKWRVKEQ